MLHGTIPSNPTKFTAECIPDQKGKIAIVTGGNAGIGYETVLHLAKKNAKVYMASRSAAKAEKAIAQIKQQEPLANVEFLALDLQDLSSVKKAAAEFSLKETQLDLLINNAGIANVPFALSKDGIESQFATNHLGHFYFTQLLIPLLLKSDRVPRIVNVSSVAHTFTDKRGILDLNDTNDAKSLSSLGRYAQSKLANILFSRSLNQKYGDRIYVNSVHPGYVDTDIYDGFTEMYGGIVRCITRRLNSWFALTSHQGALTQLYVATSMDIEEKNWKAEYFTPIANLDTGNLTKQAQSDELAEKLWSISVSILEDKKFSFLNLLQ